MTSAFLTRRETEISAPSNVITNGPRHYLDVIEGGEAEGGRAHGDEEERAQVQYGSTNHRLQLKKHTGISQLIER